MAIPSPPSLDTPPAVLYQTKRIGHMLVGGGTLALLMSAIMLLLDPRFSAQVGVTAAVGGLALLVGILSLRRPSQFILTPEGLTFVTMFRRFSWPWQQISGFEKVRISAGRTSADAIGFHVTSAAAPRSHTLPTYWGLPLEQVVTLLNKARRKWGS